jgi:regulatory protein
VSNKLRNGEEMAQVISFPDQSHTPRKEVKPWPGQVIDIHTAREMAGVSVEEAPAAPAVSEPEGDESAGESTARQIVLRTLAARGRSVAEVRAKLRDKGIDESVVDQEVARLQAEGLLNDVELAEQLVYSLTEHKKLGPVAIRQALVKRKIPGVIIDQVTPRRDEIGDGVIVQLAEDRMRVLRGLEPEVQKRRLIGFLARRGYTGSEVYRVVDQAVNAG